MSLGLFIRFKLFEINLFGFNDFNKFMLLLFTFIYVMNLQVTTFKLRLDNMQIVKTMNSLTLNTSLWLIEICA
jgi:hypothetical protein